MPVIVERQQAGVRLILLSRVDAVVEAGHVDGCEAGNIGESVVANSEDSEVLLCEVKQPIGVEFILLAMLETVEETVAIGSFSGDPCVRVSSRAPCSDQVEIAVITGE